MKNFSFIFNQNLPARLGITFIFLLMSLCHAHSQEYVTCSGFLADDISKEPIPYANTALFTLPDSVLYRGQISDTGGNFFYDRIPAGNYLFIVSVIGYENFLEKIELSPDRPYMERVIHLKSKATSIGETVVTADRIKGRAEKEKTLYYVTKKMSEVSSNGLDIVKLIPGIQVDFRRNIIFEGSQNILILVDGIERDNNYLNQICSECIEKVEVMSTPPSKYDGHYTGALNIVLKKEKKPGLSGVINMEVPLSLSRYFNHPDFSFQVGFNRLNLYVSYNGEMISLDQQETLEQKFSFSGTPFKTRSDQHVIQKLWSHRIHYGFEYSLSSKTKVDFYAFCNPYSQEYSGYMDAFSIKNNEAWHGKMLNEHRNRSYYYSIYFKHLINDKGTDLSVDLNSYHFSAENSAVYNADMAESGLSPIINSSNPELESLSAKIDLNTVIGPALKFSAGARMRSQILREENSQDFQYSETVYALYGSIEFNKSASHFQSGLRAEKSVSVLEDVFDNTKTSVLPYFLFSLKISENTTIKAGISKSIYRPNLYQLNPAVNQDDPNNVRHGNPYLDPELRTVWFLEYCRKIKTNYISSRIFYNHSSPVLSGISFINDTALIETNFENLGTIDQAGLQFSGTFNLCSSISIIPYSRLYLNSCRGNNKAQPYSIGSMRQFVVEAGLSSVIAFKKDINLSISLQYGSPKYGIQSKSFSDAFYSITLEKVFLKKLTTGLSTALPFSKKFIYQGSEIKNMELYSKYRGTINLPGPLFSIKLSYRFNTGKKLNKSGRTADEGDLLPNKGY